MKSIVTILFMIGSIQASGMTQTHKQIANHTSGNHTIEEAGYGKTIFRKKLKRICGFTGAKFVQYHTRDEWDALKENGEFRIELYRICPKTSTIIRDGWIEPLYSFSRTYALDTGKFPSC